MHLAGESAEALALLGAESGKVVKSFRATLWGSPGCKGLVGGGIVGALFDLEDDGIGCADDHAVPRTGLDVDERRVRGEVNAVA